MRQVIISGHSRALGAGPPGPEYNVLMGGTLWGTEDKVAQVVSTSGQIQSLKVKLAGAVEPWATLTLMVNGVASALTCTLNAGDTTAEDSTHVVSVSPGDYVALRGTYGVGFLYSVRWSALFLGDNDDETIILGCAGLTPLHAFPRYREILGYAGSRSSEDEAWQIIPVKGTIKNLYVRCVPPAPGAHSHRSTLRVNGADTSLTCTVTGPATTCNDTTHEVTVNPGDIVTLKVECLDVSGVQTSHNYGATFIPDQAVEPKVSGIVLGGDDSDLGIVIPQYHAPNGVHGGLAHGGWIQSELGRRQLAQLCRLKNLYVRLNAAPGMGTSYTFTVFVDGVATPLSCTISDLDTTGSDTAHVVDISDWNEVSLEETFDGPPAVREAHWGIMTALGRVGRKGNIVIDQLIYQHAERMRK